MKRVLKLSFGLGALFAARAAIAQEAQIGYQGLPYKAQNESPNGVQVSDGVLMHVGLGAEAGYDSNVFYQSSGSPADIGSGIIRTTGFAEITNSTRTGVVPSGLSFDARAGLQYRRYTSDDPAIAQNGYQNAVMPSAGLSLQTSVGPTMGLGFSDAFLRMEDPPYNPGQQQIVRDNNQAAADFRWSPGGGRIAAVLRYTNMVDIFETNTYSYADTLTQTLMLDGSWKWLPKTALFVQVQQGYVSYLNNTNTPATGNTPPKYSQFPLHAIAGLRGLVTDKIAALAAVGYANNFISCSAGTQLACVTTSGILGNSYANLELTYRPTLLSRMLLGWRHDFQNSVISTFYYDEQIYASFVQQLGSRAAVDISGRYSRKSYQGYLSPVNPAGATGPVSVPRADNSFQVGATLDYFLRNWAYAGVGYALLANESDYTLPVTSSTTSASVNYVKNQVFARLGVTY